MKHLVKLLALAFIPSDKVLENFIMLKKDLDERSVNGEEEERVQNLLQLFYSYIEKYYIGYEEVKETVVKKRGRGGGTTVTTTTVWHEPRYKIEWWSVFGRICEDLSRICEELTIIVKLGIMLFQKC